MTLQEFARRVLSAETAKQYTTAERAHALDYLNEQDRDGRSEATLYGMPRREMQRIDAAAAPKPDARRIVLRAISHLMGTPPHARHPGFEQTIADLQALLESLPERP